jgi:hypothetical protein
MLTEYYTFDYPGIIGTVDVQVTDTLIETEVNIVEADKIGAEQASNVKKHTMSLDRLRQHPSFGTCTRWELLVLPPVIRELYLENILPFSYVGKDLRAIRRGRLPILTVMLPFKDSDFNEATIFALKLPDVKITSNVTFVEGATRMDPNKPWVLQNFSRFFPTLTLSGPDTITPDSSIELTCTPYYKGELTDRRMDVQILYNNGFLPKTWLYMQGPQEFEVRSTGLAVGDTIYVNAGFPSYSGLAKKIIEVVNA